MGVANAARTGRPGNLLIFMRIIGTGPFAFQDCPKFVPASGRVTVLRPFSAQGRNVNGVGAHFVLRLVTAWYTYSELRR